MKNEHNNEIEISEAEMQKIASFFKAAADIPTDKTHLRHILLELPEKPEFVPSPYSPITERFFAAIKFALPLSAVAVMVLLISAFNFKNGVSPFVPTTDTQTIAKIDTPENVDQIVNTVYNTSVTTTAKATQVAHVAEDKALALRDKDIINDLATDYENAF